MPLQLLIALLLGSTWVTPPAQALEAGFAKADITPVLGAPLAGRLERWGRGSETIHDPLSARCLYLDDGEASIFLVSVDLYAVSPELRSRVLELAPQTVPPERIVLAATHTHSGPGGMDRGLVRRVSSGRSSPRVLEETAQQIAGCIHDAYGARRRAAVGYASSAWSVPDTMTGVNAQPAPITVMRVEDSDGAPIAIAVIAPLMPDNVGTDELLTLSSDFPGYLCKTIDDTLSGGAGALFFNGASGEYVRKEMPKNTSWDKIEALGDSVGTLAIMMSETIECGEVSIAVRSSVMQLPMSLGDSWLPDELLLTQCAVGGLTMTFAPIGISQGVFEITMTPESAETRHEIVGFANGFVGHVVPESAFAGGTAAARLHYFGPYMAQRLADEIHALLEGVDNPETLAQTDVPNEEPEGPSAEQVDGLYLLNTANKPDSLRGAALAGVIQSSFEQRIHEPGAAGTLLPRNHTLAHVPWFVDASPVALLQLAVELRPAWAGLDADQRRRLKGYADGAGLPLEAAWLLQHEEALLGYAGNTANLPSADQSLMFAVHGDKAGAEGLLAAVRIPWVHPESPMIHQGISESGIPFISLTPTYAMGTVAGMNGAGLVVCAVRNGDRGQPRMAVPPLSLQLERALGLATTADALLEELATSASLDGFDLFVADTAAEMAVVTGGSMEPESPSLSRGLTADSVIDASSITDERDDPRRTLVDFVESERIVSADEIASFLADLNAPQPQDASPGKFVSIIFEPKAKKLRVRFEGDDSAAGHYVEFALEADES